MNKNTWRDFQFCISLPLMDQQLKTKNISDLPLFCKDAFLLDRLTVLMIKINFNLLKILAMSSMNVKHQGKSSNQLAFRLSAYTHLRKLKRAISQKHKKYKLTVWIIQSLILMIKMTCKEKWMSCLVCTRQCKKNRKQHHIQNQFEFLSCTW